MEGWILPLTLLPGIGMLILSTSNQSIALANEISMLLNDKECNVSLLLKKVSQHELINQALVVLYVCVSGFALQALLSGINDRFTAQIPQFISDILLFVGTGSLVLALILLTVFSARAVRIKKYQYKSRIQAKS